jgi:hypothetical protein
MRRNGPSLVTICVYITLIAAVLWQGISLFREFTPHKSRAGGSMIDVYVDGNVRRPGKYRVIEGTTGFEILKVAGVRSTSDLSTVDLSSVIDSTSAINVGTLDNPAKINEEALAARLEFFFGEISITGGDGRSIPQHEGLAISPGDRIQTEASSQTEISVGAYSRIDMDNFSELTFDKIGVSGDNRNVVELYQKAGACWYKTVYTKNNELFKINAQPVVVLVGGSGADFLIDVQSDRIQINLMDGLLLIERAGGGEAINMISGQSVTVYNDDRPFQVTKLAPAISVNEQFAQLSREKVNYLSRQMPLNLLFCGTPSVFFLINIQYERNTWNIVRIQPELLVEQFANNINTLDEAFLFGGPVMVATFVERILDMRIPKYIVFDKSDILKIAGVMGGIQVALDANAAGYLKLSQGKQKLSESNLIKYLSPAISGSEDSWRRQLELFRSLYDGLQSKSIVPSLILADQIISSTETNFNASELMDHYSKFNEKTNWRYRELSIPAKIVKRDNRTCYDPQLEKCRELLTTYE